MPVSRNRRMRKTSSTSGDKLLTPQARVLKALVPRDIYRDKRYQDEWPLVSRTQLSVRAGYTAISGTVTRALNGVRSGSSSGAAHLGVIARGLVEEVVVDVEGVKETNYRITSAGILAYDAHIAANGPLPDAKERAARSTNARYINKGE